MSLARAEPDFSEPEPPWWEQAVVIAIIVMLTGALIGPVFAPLQQETPLLRLIWLPVYAVTLGLLALRADQVIRAWPALIILGLLVLHAYASKYWSIDPGVTTRRTIALLMSSLFAIYLGAVFRGKHLARVLMLSGLIMGLGSLVMVFGFPRIGIHQYDNAGLWRGLWYEKNQMGLVMTAGAVAAAACLASQDPRRLLPAATLAVSTLLVLATQSKTSLLCLVLGVGIVAALWAMRKGGPAMAVVCIWFGVVLTAICLYVFITEPAIVLKALGKDPSLTGRTDIWAALMRRVADHPWTGFGYQAFWGRDSIPAEFIRRETQWPVPSAHNGWIDLLVQLGWPGAISVGLTVFAAFATTLFRIPVAGAREGYFGMAYFAVFLLLSLSESVLLTNANLPWTLLLAILARGLMPDPEPKAKLAPERSRAYLTRPRIASQYAHGSRRSVLLR
ncbi:O-antigen ligase family protein [Brevundimonas sp.]|uniref:O-antigen ligase family protein n=1 Tax=Brevundimonas sp. TaxID=1871086 RepID=UPI003BAB0322